MECGFTLKRVRDMIRTCSHKIKVCSNFVSLFSVMKDNTSVYFLSQPFIFWTKRACRREILKFLGDLVKIHQIPYVMFESNSQFFFKLCITLQYHER